MQIIINENNVVTSIIRVGSVDGAIEINADVPDDIIPYKYIWVDDVFVLNPDYVPHIGEDIEVIKLQRIEESKTKLAEWLERNPMTYIDGKQYTVTNEKQDLLNSNLASYERAVEVNVQYPLKWNATGEECVSWEYRALIVLSLAIADYVSPKVAKQQSIEREIIACKTIEELNDVVIDYD